MSPKNADSINVGRRTHREVHRYLGLSDWVLMSKPQTLEVTRYMTFDDTDIYFDESDQASMQVRKTRGHCNVNCGLRPWISSRECSLSDADDGKS